MRTTKYFTIDYVIARFSFSFVIWIILCSFVGSFRELDTLYVSMCVCMCMCIVSITWLVMT